jgi:hypothetical protein
MHSCTLSSIQANRAISRGFQLAIVGTYRALQNPDLCDSVGPMLT